MADRKLFSNYIYNTLYQIIIMLSPLLVTPYIARVLGAANIGIYEYAQSIANHFIRIGMLGTTLYGQREIAYFQDRPKDRSEAFWEIEIFRLTATISCTVIYFFAFCTHGKYYELYIILLLEVLGNALDISWLFRGMENFRFVVTVNTLIKFACISSIFLFVKNSEELLIYAACVKAPLLAGNTAVWFFMKKYLVKTDLTLSKIKNGIKTRIKPILILFLPQITAEIYFLLDTTMLGIFGSNIAQVGYYSQAQKVVRIILMLITSLGAVMFPKMSAMFAKGDHEGMKNIMKNSFRFIYMLSFALMFGLCAVSSRFVPLFFGEGYEPVVFLIIIISPVLVIMASSNVIGSHYLIPSGQQKIYTMSIFAGTAVNFVLNIILIKFFDAVGASVASLTAEFTVAFVQFWYVRKNLPLKTYILSGVRYAILGAVMFLTLKLIDFALPDGKIWAIVLMSVFGAVIYFCELLITKDKNLEIAVELVTQKHGK